MMTSITSQDKIIRKRLVRLAELMVDSGLPETLLDGIIEQADRFSLLEVELLIDALYREQEEWQIFKKELDRLNREMVKEQKKLAERQKKAINDFVRDVLADKEKEVQKKIKKSLEE